MLFQMSLYHILLVSSERIEKISRQSMKRLYERERRQKVCVIYKQSLLVLWVNRMRYILPGAAGLFDY